MKVAGRWRYLHWAVDQFGQVVGAQRLEKLYAEHGLELIDQAVDEILDRSEARMRELIGAIPDGRLMTRTAAQALAAGQAADAPLIIGANSGVRT